MFQRLKGAIDSRIAEEQAKAKAAAALPVTRTPSTRRPRAQSKVDDDGAKGPDPAEFENAFALEDDSEPSTRTSTPLPETKEEVTSTNGVQTNPKDGNEEPPVRSSPETSSDVRTKLRRLEKLDARYQELLRSYRVAHSRAVSIEPFEKTLKENTPLTTIREPDALVEYLNQLKTRGDMVLDELKRVTAERDAYKQKYEDAQEDDTARQRSSSSIKSKANADVVLEHAQPQNVQQVPEASGSDSSKVKSPVSPILEVLPPKQKSVGQNLNNDTDPADSFFSYDDEIPRLQIDLKSKSEQVGELQDKVTKLEAKSVLVDGLQGELAILQEELAVTKTSNSDLSTSVQSLEQQIQDATENNEAHEAKALELVDLQERLKRSTEIVANLTAKSKIQKKIIDRLQESDATQKLDSKSKIVDLQSRIDELIAQKSNGDTAIQVIAELQKKLPEMQAEMARDQDTSPTRANLESSSEMVLYVAPDVSTTKKKRNRKKKTSAVSKGVVIGDASEAVEEAKKRDDDIETGRVSELQSQVSQLRAEISTRDEQIGVLQKKNDDGAETGLLTELRNQISQLRSDITTRDEQIEVLQKRRKTEDDLREEIENMQENLLLIGQEHVEAKETIKALQIDKKSLQDNLTYLEEQLSALKTSQEGSVKALTDLETMTADLEQLRIKCQSSESELKAAQQLAASRYKDLTELRDVLQKAQPELRSLRAENQELKASNEHLVTYEAELRKMETSTKELKKDIAAHKRQAMDRDADFKALNDKLSQETSDRLKAQDSSRVSGRDCRKLEADKIELSAANEKYSRELSTVQQETERLRNTVRELDKQVAKFSAESQTTREEMSLKNTQYDSAQGLLGSMRDQVGEMAMQLKETKEQSENLEEELAEVQRVLGERTRDAETMRRLLSEIDERSDFKIREMKDRMEAAIQERDRSEEEASTNARRRAREVDDLKIKLKDTERDLKQATKEREELEVTDKDSKRRRDELEQRSEQASTEIREVNRAMSELRDTLDQNEKQSREIERQKTDLRRLLEDANQRYEKLQRSVKQKDKRLEEMPIGEASRPSVDLDGAAKRSNGLASGMTDYVYLKTVLLQFLEQRDKKLQAQLVPVLGKLLHFDKQDEQRWVAAIVTM